MAAIAHRAEGEGGAAGMVAMPMEIDPLIVGQALARLPACVPPDEAGAACVACLEALLGVPLRLTVTLEEPMPRVFGRIEEPLETSLVVPLPEGCAELALPPGVTLPPTVAEAITQGLARLWEIQQHRARYERLLEGLRFQLAALEQILHTLAVARGVDETERYVLDAAGEVLFAWWAVFYRRRGRAYRLRAVRNLRAEVLPGELPLDVVDRTLAGAPPGPFPLPADAPLRAVLGADADATVVVPLAVPEAEPALLLLGPRMTGAPYGDSELALLRTLADAAAIALRNAHLVDRLRAQATIDPLTGCQNRRGFDERLALEFARAQRYGRPLCLILFDLDHFKLLNDTYGHEAGDDALRRIGRLLRRSFRTADDACRYGGEEFALLCPETTKAEGLVIGERVRRLIAALGPDSDVPLALTASVGVAAFPEDAASPLDLVRAADRALYQAKAAGRNCVRAA